LTEKGSHVKSSASWILICGNAYIKVPAGGETGLILTQLQGVLASSPPPWLAKILGMAPEDRVRFAVEQTS